MRVITALETITAVPTKTVWINKSSWNESWLVKTLDVVKLYEKMCLKGNFTQEHGVIVVVHNISNTFSHPVRVMKAPF